MQPDKVQKWLVQNAFGNVGGAIVGQREAELLIVDPRRHRRMAADVDVGGDPDQHLLRPAHLAGQEGDLHRRIDDDAADSDGGRVAQLVDRLGVAVHDDSRRVEASGQRDRQLAARADVESCAFVGHPARDVGRQ